MQGKQRNTGVYPSGFRSFSRGGSYRRSGRGKASFHAARPQLPLPQRQADVMLEAGRLAAEYLVAKGLLPATSLPLQTASARSWPSGDVGEIGRPSALSRLGRRRFEEEDAGFNPRNQKGRGGRRRQWNGSYSRQGSEWERENGRGDARADFWPPEKGQSYSDAGYSDDFERGIRWPEGSGGFHEIMEGDDPDRGADFEEAARSAATDEMSLISKSESESEPEIRRKLAESTGAPAMDDSETKPAPAAEAGENSNITPDEPEDAEIVKDEAEDVAAPPCPTSEDKQADRDGEAGITPLTFSDFAKVPTRPRSALCSRIQGTDMEEKETEEEEEAKAEEEHSTKPEQIPSLSPQNEAFAEQSPSELPESSTGIDSTGEISRSSSEITWSLISYVDHDHSKRPRESSQEEKSLQDPDAKRLELLPEGELIDDLNLMGSSSAPPSSDNDMPADFCVASKSEIDQAFPNLDNFLSNHEIQGGYGLSLSEFLGSDVAGCSSMHADISNLPADMALEGIAAVEDSLYVAYEEIPIGFMEVWDPPPSDYGKFF